MGVGYFHTNFSRGQLSANVYARIDTDSYKNGAKQMVNVMPLLQGGFVTRPGTEIVASLTSATGGVRLEGVVIDTDETYVFAFSDARLEVFSVGSGGALTSTDVFTAQDWDSTSMWLMSVEISGGLMFIADQSFSPKFIYRVGVNDWTLEDFSFDQREDALQIFQPYHKYASTYVTLAPSNYTVGTGRTLVASEDFFDSSMINEHFLIRGGEVKITGVTDAQNATCEVLRELRVILDSNPFTAHESETRVTCTWVGHGLVDGDTVNFKGCGDGIDQTGARTFQGSDIDGNRTVIEVLNEDQFSFTAGGSSTDTFDFGGSDVWARTTAAAKDWQEPAFSAYRGYPQAVCVHDGRLWFAGPPQAPTARWASRSGNFFNFDLDKGEANDGIKAVSATGGSQIRHLVSAEDLEFYMVRGEGYMSGGVDPLNQSNVRAKVPSAYGAAYTKPRRFDGSTMFVDAVGQHVREFLYDDNQTATYTASPVTALSYDIINQPYHSASYDGDASYATPFVIYTNTDGTAALFHSARKEGIGGWSKWTLEGGTFESFAGASELLYCATKRGSLYFIELFSRTYRADGVDDVGGSGTSHTTTRTHLKSQTVDVFTSAGVWLEQVAVDSSGNFTLSTSQTSPRIGLPVEWTVETLPPAMQLGSESNLVPGDYSTLAGIVPWLVNTDKLTVGRTVKTYTTSYTGMAKFRGLGWALDPTVTFTGNISHNAQISGCRVEVS